MFAKTYFDNATKCFSRWLELIQTDYRMASEYHSRGCELIDTYARITGEAPQKAKAMALGRAAVSF
jgi:hypothetical protein